ncbi:MAG: hypothetical protein E6I88_08160 [Chloroflexi bacterium]|nr:MAG: hypothetical protein E6I88_08160 [Chloroflexota bacterium]TME45082.1 MAG: hypothetical protein E6I56_10330 [Chloroflexota bacterium]
MGRLVLGLMQARRVGLVALLLGLLSAALLHGRLGAPPVYDGIVVPPAPYRYESPPPNLRNGNQLPLGGQAVLPAPNGTVAGGGVQTDDQQVITFWGLGTLKAPAGTSSVTCTIQPVANPPAPPAGVELRGNVYAINCVGQPANGKVTATTTFHLTMRIPPGTVNDIRYYDGQSWHNLTTLFAGGGDPYASVNAPGFGEYAAMARSGTATSSSPFSDLSRYLEFYGILALVLLFGIIAVAQEIRRRRQRRPSTVKKR